MSHPFDREREVASRAVREAARICRAVRGKHGPDPVAKGDKSPVTVADFGSQALICATLAAAFPGDPIMAEEDAAELRKPEHAGVRDRVAAEVAAIRAGTDAETALGWIDLGDLDRFEPRFWTLDPIDGTKGFLRGEQYAIALALIVEGRVEVAALACPNLEVSRLASGPVGAVFLAVRGRGATVCPLDGDDVERPITVSDRDDPTRARLCESVESGHSAHNESAAVAARLGVTEPPVRLDSQAKYATVASGLADVYLRLPTRADYRERIWDHAAGALIVAEAGGTVTDVDGKPLDFTLGSTLASNRGVVATNGRLHPRVIEALRG
ncbi:3'(2'),5'-bisphosphate nucleotidase [Tautonia plasticadhaerens]|uniref:3'(2'),5'-bisphosphate nucleotidase n=1 Tax=Tautonia plasticadhaerens TaxID=2527974 RepID=A0A518H4R5_9BACT|nr:3'(2'),5'-bisphosphate nucleotidase [Tautonia plasticadhaerens]QDV35836.1 Inositol-1-monophosphatase [Tautonia plasticadhaerens]